MRRASFGHIVGLTIATVTTWQPAVRSPIAILFDRSILVQPPEAIRLLGGIRRHCAGAVLGSEVEIPDALPIIECHVDRKQHVFHFGKPSFVGAHHCRVHLPLRLVRCSQSCKFPFESCRTLFTAFGVSNLLHEAADLLSIFARAPTFPRARSSARS